MVKKAKEYGIFNKLNKTEQLLFLIYDESGQKIEYYEQLLSYISNNSYICNQSNQSTYVTISRKTILDLLERELIEQDKSITPRILNITEKGKIFVENKIEPEKKEIENKLKEKNKEKEYDIIRKKIYNFFRSSIIEEKTLFNKDKEYIIIYFNELISYDIELGEFLTENPELFLDIAEKTIFSFFDINKKIYVKKLSNDCRRSITNLRYKDLNKLVSIVGEVRSRSQTELELVNIKYRCMSCDNQHIIKQNSIKIKKPFRCQCGSKGFILEDKEYQDVLKITLWDLYEELGINQIPEEINVVFEKDHFGFNTVEEGQKVRINGILKTYQIEETKTKTLKIIKCIGLERLGTNFSNINITEEDKEKIKEINQNPVEFYFKKAYSDVKNNNEAKTLALLSNYGDINMLFVGDAGTGKSMIAKRTIKYSLKGTHLDAVKTSKSGLSGASTKNEFTGKYTLDAGAIRKIHPYGVCVIDEIQFNKELQKDLYSIISDKRIRIAKANINAEFPCHINIIATANPIKEDYTGSLSLSSLFDIEKALIDRFGFIIFFESEKPSKKNIYDMCKIKEIKQEDWTYSEEEKKTNILIKKHQIIARKIKPVLKEEDYHYISIWATDIWSQMTGKKTSNRAVEQLIQVLEAWCRLHHRDYTIKEDYQKINDLFIGIERLKNNYINDRKLNHSEEELR